MPLSKYIRVAIDNDDVDIPSTENFPIVISYKLEDKENFQSKKSSEAFDVTFPATVKNDQISNTFHNPGVDDTTPNNSYRSARNVMVESNSHELLIGKALLKNAKHNDRPLQYIYDFYGNNGDWIIDLKETTLFDFLKQINFTFTKQKIIDSWLFDGTDETLPFVFAPVRYGQPMDTRKVIVQQLQPSGGFPIVPVLVDVVVSELKDFNMKPEYMRPSLSKWWIIYWAFKSLGYKIQSDFFETEYFRRQVMPWTWGNFLYSDGTRLNNLDFLAKSTETVSVLNTDFTGFLDVKATNESLNGAFDNNGVYDYVSPEMKWTYLPAFNYGKLEATFHLNMAVTAVATANSDVELRVQWFKNGVRVLGLHDDNGNGTELVNLDAQLVGRLDFIGQVDDFFTSIVDPGDVISAKIYLHTFHSGAGIARIHASVDEFGLDYFRIPLGGQIDFQNYTALKKYKFLDFIAGVIDEFNIAIQTDPINKVVCMEPMHDYSLDNNLGQKQGGYFNGKYIDWEEKQDLLKTSDLDLFNDSERELIFKYKDDNSDGILKVVQDRFVTNLATGKYVFPDRFKAGKKEIVNRFFSPVMHYEVNQWKGLGIDAGAAPQMICLVPENVSNTSRQEAQNTFEPKSAYYKGLDYSVGWVFDDEEQNSFPYMFAVNYKAGGENDPILSYSDEKIGPSTAPVVGKGLLKRFYWQRMAILRNGQVYDTFFHLKNIDITNFLHREHIVCRGQRWELVEIKNYMPLKEESTGCFMRKWSPIAEIDFNNTFPAADNVLDISPILGAFDIKYSPLKCLFSDIKNE